MLRTFYCLLCLSITNGSAYSQSVPPLRTQSTTLSLYGTVSRVAGSLHESGSVVLTVSPDGSWSEDWALDSRSIQKSSADCSEQTSRSSGNRDVGCRRTLPWFAPWTLANAVGSGKGTIQEIAEAGQKRVLLSPSSVAKAKQRASLNMPNQSVSNALMITYDPSTSLPTRMDLVDYLDAGGSQKVDTYVLFSDFREEQGVMIPHHIVRYIQRTLESDIQITSVTTR